MWVDTSVKTPTWRRRHSRRACFPDQGRGGAPRSRCRHAMEVGAHVPPDATRIATVYTNDPKRLREAVFADLCTLFCTSTTARATLTLQQCTQMAKNCVERPFSPICVHSCIPMPVYNGATVYTNDPKRLREAVFADLCTLFCTSTTARATGRGYGSHDVDDPMAPAMPGRSDLTPTPPGR